MAAWTEDLFAPAFTKGDPSEERWNQWFKRNYSMTNPMVEQTRMPTSFNAGNPAGMIDPEAARVLAQGGPYDVDARRNSIAQALQAQQAAAPVAAGVQRSPNDAGRLTYAGGGVYLPEFDTSGGAQTRVGYPWGQNSPDVTS